MCVWSCVRTSGQHTRLCTIPDALMSLPANDGRDERWELKKKNTVASELSLFICFSTHNAMGFVCGNSQRMDECSKINIQTNWSPFWVWDVKRDRETTTKLFAYRKLATSAAKRSIYRIYEYRLIESTLKNFHLDRIVSPLCPSASVWSNENK